MVCSIMGAPIRGPEPLRGPTVSHPRVLLGSGFHARKGGGFGEAASWPLTLAGLLLFVAIAGARRWSS